MKKLLVLPLLLLLGCAPTTRAEKEIDAVHELRQLVYVKDPRTGLCFAMLKSTNGHFGDIISLTTVPCKVLYDRD